MALEILARHIEDVDEHFHVFEDVLSLALEELLHEEVLTSTIPEGQHQVAEEPNARFGDVDCEGDSVCITSQVVGEDE